MSQLTKLLTEQYEKHYSRVNVIVDPTKPTKRLSSYMDLMYGNFVNSLPEGSQILDLGCGTGFLLHWLSRQPNIIPHGVDNSPSQIQVLKENLPNIEISCEDGLKYLKKHTNIFHGIFCVDVLEHLETNETCFEWVEAAFDALVSGGFFYCRVPNAANLTGCYSRYMDLTHMRSFTDLSLLQLLEVGGLEDCRIVPVRANHLSGQVRLVVEAFLHKMVYLTCGRCYRNAFTKNISIVGLKKLSQKL